MTTMVRRRNRDEGFGLVDTMIVFVGGGLAAATSSALLDRRRQRVGGWVHDADQAQEGVVHRNARDPDFDWRRSRAHLWFLSSFLEPRAVDDMEMVEAAEEDLGEKTESAVSRLLRDGMLQCADPAVKWIPTTGAALRTIAFKCTEEGRLNVDVFFEYVAGDATEEKPQVPSWVAWLGDKVADGVIGGMAFTGLTLLLKRLGISWPEEEQVPPTGIRDQAKERAVYYAGRADCHREQGHSDEAIAYYERAINEDPQLVMPRLNLALIYEQYQHYENATPAYTDLISLVGAISQDYERVINVCQKRGDVEGRLDAYRVIASLARVCAYSYNALANIRWEEGDREGAVGLFEQASQADKSYGPPSYNLGLLYEDEGDLAQAVAFWEKARDNSDDPDVVEAAREKLRGRRISMRIRRFSESKQE
jgi:tetratricopeptide (TPR) repeat protein